MDDLDGFRGQFRAALDPRGALLWACPTLMVALHAHTVADLTAEVLGVDTLLVSSSRSALVLVCEVRPGDHQVVYESLSVRTHPDHPAPTMADIRLAEATAERILGSSPLITLVLDTSLCPLYLNPAALEAFELELPAALGTPLRLPNASFDVSTPEIIERLGRGERIEATLRLERSAGVRQYQVHLSPVHPEPDAVLLLLVLAQDVTAQTQALAALDASQAHYLFVLDQLNDVVYETDATGRFTFLNRAWTAITGFEVSDSLGRMYLDFVDPRDKAASMARARAFAASPSSSLASSVRFVARDGAVVHFDVSSTLQRDGSGSLTGTIGTFVDATERIRSQLELERSRHRAEEASSAKSQFLSHMSHEMRTPLNAILGFAQIIELDGDEASKESAQQIRTAGDHLLSLVNESLDISRVEAGRVDVRLERVDLATLADDCVRLVTPLVPADQRLEVSLASVLVLADPQRLKQVVINILTNAIKYNRPDGTVRVELSASGAARLSVSDTGYGISPDKLERLFTPFDRLGASSLIEGTGLGLALSKNLVRLMGSSLEVVSTEGVGSTFSVEFPASLVLG